MYIKYLTQDDIYDYMNQCYDDLVKISNAKGIPLVMKTATLRNAESWNTDNVQEYIENDEQIIVIMNCLHKENQRLKNRLEKLME